MAALTRLRRRGSPCWQRVTTGWRGWWNRLLGWTGYRWYVSVSGPLERGTVARVTERGLEIGTDVQYAETVHTWRGIHKRRVRPIPFHPSLYGPHAVGGEHERSTGELHLDPNKPIKPVAMDVEYCGEDAPPKPDDDA